MPDRADSELDRIDPDLTIIKLDSGLPVEVVRLKTRQFFRLLKVLTHGGGQAMLSAGLNFSDPGEEFAQRLVSLVLLSIPDAESEAIEFVQSMVKPVGLVPGLLDKLSKSQREHNDELWAEVGRELYNPDLEDLVSIIETVVRAEASDIQALGKRLASLMSLAQKTGQDKPGTAEAPPAPEDLQSQESTSSASSPPSSTSSAATTDGVTSESSGSVSAVSGRSRKRSASGERELTSSPSA